MRLFEITVPCHFGLESVTKNEILDLGYEITRVEDGRVSFEADAEGIVRANLGLRTVERVLIRVGEFPALTFDELYERTKELPWHEYIPVNGRFWVTKATSLKSRLFSIPDVQSVMKKAMVDRLGAHYGRTVFPENGDDFPVRVNIFKDRVSVYLDTTGVPLHKRGYRRLASRAPISETLAAALIGLTPWRGDRILVDPFCGSGTFPIEAAMMAANIAPGLERSFTAEAWHELIDPSEWRAVREEARDLVDLSVKTDIQGYDIDGNVIRAAKENARAAGVADLVHLQKRDVAQLSHGGSYGFVITNPPYGERLEQPENLPKLYQTLGERFRLLDKWSLYMITSFENAPACMGMVPAKERKVYNSMIRTRFYQFPGERPPRKRMEHV